MSTNSSTDSLALAREADALCDRFEQALRRGEAADLDHWLPAPGPLRAAALPELARVELEHRLLAGDPAQAEEYLARYPELAADSAGVALLRAAQQRISRNIAQPPPSVSRKATAPHAESTVVLANAPVAPFLTRPSDGVFDEEVRRLLRSRLILVHLLTLALGVLIVAIGFYPTMLIEVPAQQRHWLGLELPLAECLIGAVVLWRLPGMSQRSLRLWELAHFGLLAAHVGLTRFVNLAYLGEGWLNPLALPFFGVVTVQGFIPLILAYGVLIPNTRQRSLLVVAALTAVPFAALAAAVVASPELRAIDITPLVMQNVVTLLFPAVIAVFAAARQSALQRRAFEAEWRAERIGQYALTRKLGAGAMGEVWLAEHALLKRPCAVKFIRPDLAAHPAMAARFAREVQAVTGLSHLNTVRVYDYGRADDGSFYYVMEYLDGPTLEELVREEGPLPPGRVVYLLRQVCGALVEAHAAGLVHRDIKPGNVIIAALGGQRDVAKLLDFGLVQDLSADAADRLTRAGTVLGTPAYMSPEQAAGESAVDARGDVYALGAVAFFTLTGRPPFERKTIGQLLAAHRSELPPPLTDLRPEVPADLAAVVARCLAKDANDRFQSAADLESALRQCGCASDWSAERAAAWWQVQVGDGKLSEANNQMQSSSPA